MLHIAILALTILEPKFEMPTPPVMTRVVYIKAEKKKRKLSWSLKPL